MKRFKLGIDLGRSEVRIHDGEQLVSFPALLGGPVPLSRGIALDPEKGFVVRIGDRGYSIGRLALQQPYLLPLGLADFASELDLVLLLGALGLYIHRNGLKHPSFDLCLGVPASLAQNPRTLEGIRAWQGTHRFDWCGNEIELEIGKLDVLPQPMGALYSAVLSGQIDCDPESPEGIDSLVGIVDLGHASTSWMVARLNGDLAHRAGTLTSTAGLRLFDKLEELMSAQGLQAPNPLAAFRALETGELKGNRLSAETIDGIEALCDLMAQQVALTVQQKWNDLTLERILITGGLGKRLYQRLIAHPFLKEALLVEQPREANAIGFGEYAAALGDAQTESSDTTGLAEFETPSGITEEAAGLDQVDELELPSEISEEATGIDKFLAMTELTAKIEEAAPPETAEAAENLEGFALQPADPSLGV